MMDAANTTRELISFKVGDQEFCVNVMDVREIRGWTVGTPLPGSPDFLRGVINLRGIMMPVIDLSARFGRGVTEPSARHVVIVVEVGDVRAGLLVDAVCETFNAKDGDIQAAPAVAGPEVNRFVKGLICFDERTIALLSLADILDTSNRRLAMEAEAEAA